MKKIIALALIAVMAIAAFAGCSNKETASENKLSIVTTIFPEYDWVMQVLGNKADKADVSMLLDNGVDLHSYQPSADDIVKISNCDMFIYVGGESDEWVEDVLAGAKNKNMAVINLLEVLGDSVKDEEVVEGMEHDHDHEHEHEEIEESDIKDRTLDEFAGDWKSLYPYLENGDLEEYVEHHAEEHGEEADEVREELLEKWECDAKSISVNGNEITFVFTDGTTKKATYKYAGFLPVKDDDGDITGVRYQFETDSKDAPRYVQFNDHGHEPEDEVEHFHIYFGNDGFDALMKSGSNPFFVPDSLTVDEINEELTGGHDHSHGEEAEKDEHVWLSLRNAETLCKEIADELGKIDADNKDAYKANADAYAAKLRDLDGKYKDAVNSAPVKTLLFGDRFPFRYLVDDYGLSYYAAFAGCSAESEASFETIVFLADKVDELGLRAIMQIESADGKIANTIKDTTSAKDQVILTLDSMQSTTASDIEGGATYLSAMEKNLEVLKDALK